MISTSLPSYLQHSQRIQFSWNQDDKCFAWQQQNVHRNSGNTIWIAQYLAGI